MRELLIVQSFYDTENEPMFKRSLSQYPFVSRKILCLIKLRDLAHLIYFVELVRDAVNMKPNITTTEKSNEGFKKIVS